MTHETNIEHRIAHLERRANRYRNALAVLVIGLCAIAVVGATTDDGIITGRQLVIKNSDGRPIIDLGENELREGALRIFSRNGAKTVEVRGSDGLAGGGMIQLYQFHDAEDWGSQIPTVQLGTTYEGGGYMWTTANTRSRVIWIGVEEGEGVVKVNHSIGERLLISAGGRDGRGFLQVGKVGGSRTTIGSAEHGFFVAGYNKTGEPVVSLYADDYGNGVVGAYNRKGVGRTLESR